jgi:hypothetical protein
MRTQVFRCVSVHNKTPGISEDSSGLLIDFPVAGWEKTCAVRGTALILWFGGACNFFTLALAGTHTCPGGNAHLPWRERKCQGVPGSARVLLH